MLPHLLVLLAFAFSGALGGMLTWFIGTDLFTNKVLLGQKLQPLQAVVLFLPEEYVVENAGLSDTSELSDEQGKSESRDISAEGKPLSLAGAKGKGKGMGKGEAQDLGDYKPELTDEQRRSVRNRLLIWSAIGGSFLTVVFSVF